jgi:hypothetical protein
VEKATAGAINLINFLRRRRQFWDPTATWPADNPKSGLLPKAELAWSDWQVRFVPKPDSCSAAKNRYSITSLARASRIGGLQVVGSNAAAPTNN